MAEHWSSGDFPTIDLSLILANKMLLGGNNAALVIWIQATKSYLFLKASAQ